MEPDSLLTRIRSFCSAAFYDFWLHPNQFLRLAQLRFLVWRCAWCAAHTQWGRNHPVLKDGVCDEVNPTNLSHAKEIFKYNYNVGWEQLKNAIGTPTCKTCQIDAVVRKMVSLVASKGTWGYNVVLSIRDTVGKAIRSIVTGCRVVPTCVLPFVRVVKEGLLSFTVCHFLLTMHPQML